MGNRSTYYPDLPLWERCLLRHFHKTLSALVAFPAFLPRLILELYWSADKIAGQSRYRYNSCPEGHRIDKSIDFAYQCLRLCDKTQRRRGDLFWKIAGFSVILDEISIETDSEFLMSFWELFLKFKHNHVIEVNFIANFVRNRYVGF